MENNGKWYDTTPADIEKSIPIQRKALEDLKKAKTELANMGFDFGNEDLHETTSTKLEAFDNMNLPVQVDDDSHVSNYYIFVAFPDMTLEDVKNIFKDTQKTWPNSEKPIAPYYQKLKIYPAIETILNYTQVDPRKTLMTIESLVVGEIRYMLRLSNIMQYSHVIEFQLEFQTLIELRRAPVSYTHLTLPTKRIV